MAADIPYQRIDEEPGRPSIETIPGDDQRLLDTLYDDESPPPPKKGVFKFKLSYHPTFYLRLVVVILFITSFIVAISSKHSIDIPTDIFLAFAIFRNLIILYQHVAGHSPIRIRIEIAGRTTSASNAKPKEWRPKWFLQRLIQVAIDWVLIGVLIATTITGNQSELNRYRWDRGSFLSACIVAWVALPLYALSTIDIGRPSRLKFANAVSFDVSKDKHEDEEQGVMPRAYQHIQASGGLQGDMTRKTGADSPPMI